MTYNLCLLLLKNGRLTAELLDVYLAAGRVTTEQYRTLIEKLQEDGFETGI